MGGAGGGGGGGTGRGGGGVGHLGWGVGVAFRAWRGKRGDEGGFGGGCGRGGVGVGQKPKPHGEKGVKFNMTPNGERQKPVQSVPGFASKF